MMKTRHAFLSILCVVLWLPCITLHAQLRLSGTTVDTDGQPVPGVIVRVYDADGRKTMGYATTAHDGTFHITLQQEAERVRVLFSSMGFAKVEKVMDRSADLGKVVLHEEDTDMKEVTVKAPPVSTRGDTIVYNVAQVKSQTDRKVEDVIKRLPGIEVEESGAIKYNGKPINKFYIEGADMLGGRYSLATRNIEADDIASISVYQNHQPKRVLQGISFSDQAALNLTLRQQRMLKPIGKASLGCGYGDEVLWNADAYTLLVAPDKQFLVTAKGNSMAQFYDSELANHINSNTSLPYAQGQLKPLLSNPSYVSPTRSQANRSVASTYNSLHKLGEGLDLVVTAGYHFDHRRASMAQRTTYWQHEETPVVVDESSSSRGRSHQGWLNVRVENNKGSTYINESFNLEGQLSDHRDLLDGTRTVGQDITADNFLVTNMLQAIWRRDNRVFDFNSTVTFGHASEGLSAPADVLDETLAGQRLHTLHSTSYRWVLGRRVTLSLNASLQADYDHLAIHLAYPTGNDESRYGGLRVKTSVYTSFTLTNTKVRGTIDLPFDLVDLHYRNAFNHQRYDYDRPLVGLRGNFYYDLFHHIKVQFGGSYMHDVGTMTDYVTTPFYTDYRTTRTLGTGVLNGKDKLTANVALTYRNPLTGLFASLEALYQHAASNLLTGSNVSLTQTDQVFREQKNHTNMCNVGVRMTKNIFALHTLLGVRGNLSLNRIQTLRQGVLCRLGNNVYSFGANAQTTLFARHLVVGLDGEYTLSAQHISQVPTVARQHSVNLLASATVFPLPGWGLYVRGNGSYLEKTDLQFYVDAGTQYQVGRFEFELSMRNLTNRREYVVRQLSACDTLEYLYRLRPLEGMAIIRYSF